MQNLQKFSFQKNFLIFISTIFLFTFFLSPIKVEAKNILGFNDPPQCVTDTVLPVLVICGRNKTSAGTCTQYTNECTLPDLVEMAGRVVSFILLLALLIVPLIIMWYGALIIWLREGWFPNLELFGLDKDQADMLRNLKGHLWKSLIFFILMLSAWLIVRTIVDVFQVKTDRINTFLLEQDGSKVKARQFQIN